MRRIAAHFYFQGGALILDLRSSSIQDSLGVPNSERSEISSVRHLCSLRIRTLPLRKSKNDGQTHGKKQFLLVKTPTKKDQERRTDMGKELLIGRS